MESTTKSNPKRSAAQEEKHPSQGNKDTRKCKDTEEQERNQNIPTGQANHASKNLPKRQEEGPSQAERTKPRKTQEEQGKKTTGESDAHQAHQENKSKEGRFEDQTPSNPIHQRRATTKHTCFPFPLHQPRPQEPMPIHDQSLP
jgi:hypothetical protein